MPPHPAYLFMNLFIYFGARVQTQDLVHARQAIYHQLSYIHSSLKYFLQEQNLTPTSSYLKLWELGRAL
jgi:hypothetical protein